MKKMASASIAILSVSALFLALGNHSLQPVTGPIKVKAQDRLHYFLRSIPLQRFSLVRRLL